MGPYKLRGWCLLQHVRPCQIQVGHGWVMKLLRIFMFLSTWSTWSTRSTVSICVYRKIETVDRVDHVDHVDKNKTRVNKIYERVQIAISMLGLWWVIEEFQKSFPLCSPVTRWRFLVLMLWVIIKTMIVYSRLYTWKQTSHSICKGQQFYYSFHKKYFYKKPSLKKAKMLRKT